MNCPLCGEICRCPQEPLPSAATESRPEFEATIESTIASKIESGPAPALAANLPSTALEAEDRMTPTEQDGLGSSGPATDDAPAWREELSDRLNRYRARRKVPPPRYPSLRLQFDAPVKSAGANESSPASHFETISNQALALDGMLPSASEAESETESEGPPEYDAPTPIPAQVVATPVSHPSAKIIEFPRFAWAPPAPPPDQLAEPVSTRPRILEVPEVAPPPPALGGITIEAVEPAEVEKRPGIDIPLQTAPLGRRLVAALVDGLIIALASALFGFIFWRLDFWRLDALRPPAMQILGLAAAIPCLFWVAYEYLLIVYSGSTPGLRAAGLELARFDGAPANRSLRRWRVLASYLSAAALGMGYAWVFLDEDNLCWHDRATLTYLAPRKSSLGNDSPTVS